ncbi:hypothetical protein [Saccharopolyspora cebuensis]|uniref:DUF3093 domain-containing protein n=1 Tax=Saccharopolyspora cebuensis TaxID=418759 RepID=A0ABV4CRT5_9PSEU
MTDHVLYAEPGSTWWPVAWGPAFALFGLAVEGLTPGPVNLVPWTLIGMALAGAAALWVHGRRRLCSLRLTPDELVQGRERVEVSRIAEVGDVGAPIGARVLGGGWTAPKGTGEVPIRLTGGDVVLGWAKEPAALTEHLTPLVHREP